ncbi:hypothetical protein RHSIM_Rhsim12G0212700 [Rhododendron simsii]|uniref:Uncharacterized protein n=1 Tax=Rhododendron simsii TaxID=118357 RepID=A0A834L8N1_RHOSS|nr:hypothetical protein RHSIM_Rhsim12G0212700 [Rhododendron simsii]
MKLGQQTRTTLPVTRSFYTLLILVRTEDVQDVIPYVSRMSRVVTRSQTRNAIPEQPHQAQSRMSRAVTRSQTRNAIPEQSHQAHPRVGLDGVILDVPEHQQLLVVLDDLTRRTVDTQDICVDKRSLLHHRPFSIRGYVYWANWGWSNLFTLDVETEVFLEFPVPESSMQGWRIWYKEVGNFLGCMFWCSNSFVFEVLVLADPKTELKPIAWVNNGEVVVFTTFDRASTSYIAYNVETGETYSFDMGEENRGTLFWCPHVNSLASFHLPQ